MADLGAIGMRATAEPLFRVIPSWASDDSRPLLAIPVNGYYAGVVRENGSPMANAFVRLHYASLGTVISQLRTGSDGAFRFDYLEPGVTDKYYLLFFDAPGGSAYRMKGFDQVPPVAL